MTSINLLPWREEVRKYQNNLLYVEMGAAVLAAAFICLVTHVYLDARTTVVQEDNKYLKGEADTLESRIKEIASLQNEKKSLKLRMDVIQSLQDKRFFVVRLMNALVQVVPEGMYLTSIVQQDKKIVIEGKAESNGLVAQFMKNLREVSWLSGATVEEISQQKSSGEDLGKANQDLKDTFFKLEVNNLSDG